MTQRLTAEEIDAVNAASFDWPLTADSVVVELGGYQGRWAAEIARRYNPRLYVFEPQLWAWERCCAALEPWPRAQVFDYGLGIFNGDFPMGDYGTDGCSFVKRDQARPAGTGHMQEMTQTFQRLGLETIDLVLMNIEGYEYPLLWYMLAQRLIPDRVAGLMVQFHDLAPGHDREYATLRADLGRWYGLRFDFGMTLTGWERR